ncbi:MAG: class I SAM-dependent methyltransferase [Dokdonella sp.]
MQRTSSASSTALLIAASLALQDERGLAAGRIPTTTIALARQALRATGWPWQQIGWAVRFAVVRAAFDYLERSTLPGIQSHYLLRKERLAVWAEQAYADGYRQLLVLGAGFDGLAADLAQRHADFNACEWDHPATQALKREALRATNFDTRNLGLHAVDIARDDVSVTLVNSALEPGTPTLIVAEGLLMYLPLERCRQLLDTLTQRFTGPLRIAFSYMEHRAHGLPGFANARPSVTRWLQRRGEPFLWACRYETLVRSLADRHLHLLEADDATTAPVSALPGWIACPGETLCLVQADR